MFGLLRAYFQEGYIVSLSLPKLFWLSQFKLKILGMILEVELTSLLKIKDGAHIERFCSQRGFCSCDCNSSYISARKKVACSPVDVAWQDVDLLCTRKKYNHVSPSASIHCPSQLQPLIIPSNREKQGEISHRSTLIIKRPPEIYIVRLTKITSGFGTRHGYNLQHVLTILC